MRTASRVCLLQVQLTTLSYRRKLNKGSSSLSTPNRCLSLFQSHNNKAKTTPQADSCLTSHSLQSLRIKRHLQRKDHRQSTAQNQLQLYTPTRARTDSSTLLRIKDIRTALKYSKASNSSSISEPPSSHQGTRSESSANKT